MLKFCYVSFRDWTGLRLEWNWNWKWPNPVNSKKLNNALEQLGVQLFLSLYTQSPVVIKKFRFNCFPSSTGIHLKLMKSWLNWVDEKRMLWCKIFSKHFNLSSTIQGWCIKYEKENPPQTNNKPIWQVWNYLTNLRRFILSPQCPPSVCLKIFSISWMVSKYNEHYG